MCENTGNHRRRSVKFADAPPEVLRFSYNQPNWVIPLSSSASTSSISALKRALDEGRQKANTAGKTRTVVLRRSVKLNAEAVQSWTLNRRKLGAQDTRTQRLNTSIVKRKREILSSETDDASDDTKSSSCSSNFSKLLSQSCDSLSFLNLRATQACLRKLSAGSITNNNNNIVAKNGLIGEDSSSSSSKDAKKEVDLKPGIIRAKLRAASKLAADRGTRYSKANSAGDADGRWLSSNCAVDELIESDDESDDLEMARHIAECLEQFNTGLDKVLQARQLLESTQDLPPDDKDKMLRVLNQAIRTGRKRLDVSGEQLDSVESFNSSPNSVPSHRQTTMQANLSPSSEFQGGIDPAVFIQRYGDQLLALVQNQAKQN